MTLSPDVLAALGVAAALIVYIWHEKRESDKRVAAVLETKASIAMVEGVRNEMREAMEQLGEKVDHIRDTEQSTAITLAEIRQQMGRLVSNAESEKGTRARADERIERLFFGEIRALRDSIRGYGRRRSDSPDTEQ